MMSLLKKWYGSLAKIYEKKLNGQEDGPVLQFITSLNSDKRNHFLDVGCGLGRFLGVLHTKCPAVKLQGLEINEAMARQVREKGFEVTVGSVLQMPFQNEIFDIVHCSHVIEHFKYPEVIEVLNEMLRVLKVGGFLIIRTPLLSPDFFTDIDHVRPYPPESILHYFNHRQQQRFAPNTVHEVMRWYRRENVRVRLYPHSHFFQIINLVLGVAWGTIGIPFSRRNGYILVLQKNS